MKTSVWFGSLLALGLLVVFALVTMTRARRQQSQYKEYMARAEEHMKRIEAQGDEMIRLLAEIRDRLG